MKFLLIGAAVIVILSLWAQSHARQGGELRLRLAVSTRAVVLDPADYPAIAAMTHDGWMNDAAILSPKDARHQGLRIVRYQLQITTDPVGADRPFTVRYRPVAQHRPVVQHSPGTGLPRQFFAVTNGRA